MFPDDDCNLVETLNKMLTIFGVSIVLFFFLFIFVLHCFLNAAYSSGSSRYQQNIYEVTILQEIRLFD